MPNAKETRITEAQRALADLGLPPEQQNPRAALTLLALLGLEPTTPWANASGPRIGITPIMDYAAKHYDSDWAPNTRESVRRQTIHQFVHAGLVVPNPDEPGRATNSPLFCYQIAPRALDLLRTLGRPEWPALLKAYLADVGSLAEQYSQLRNLARIPIVVHDGASIELSPGGQNVLVRKIMEEFCPRFTPGANPIYVGDTGEKWAYFDKDRLAALGVAIESHGKMPDVVIHHVRENWLVLIEAVTSHGPVSPQRLVELKALFKGSSAGLVFVTAFLDRSGFTRYLSTIAWETEVWIAETPDHMIHFNGERFLGPYDDDS